MPACPDWRIRDLLAHLAGVAEDAADGGYFADAMDAWRDPRYAAAREVWTAGHVAGRADRHSRRCFGRLDEHGERLAGLLRRASGWSTGPAWLVAAPVADLSVHLVDLRRRSATAGRVRQRISRFGFAAYRHWLGQRLIHQQLPALRLS